MSAPEQFQAIVIGSGQGANPLSVALAGAGLHTALIERRHVGGTRGFMKAIVDAVTGQILGAAVLGLEGGEIMSMLEVAIMGKLPHTVLREAVFAHPTLAESLNNLFTHFDS